MIGQTISHYKVLEKLGEGGMGVVYKAHDSTLDREVALKFLPSHVSATDQETQRFLQEARSAAALNHPNICTVHGIEEYQGTPYIVMEYVDGQTLDIKRRTISFSQALEIGIQVAEGLAAAHERGIIHRDIKPENIMIRKDGIVQIMDFGLAKLRGVSRLTKQGSTVGTAGYMSPEQVQGFDVDHRSDIFSLGVVLYELFSGQFPFKGVHETAITYEIVNVDPQPPSTVKPEIPLELDQIILDCIAKNPAERYQSAAEVARNLRKIKKDSGIGRKTGTADSLPAKVTIRNFLPRERMVWASLSLLLLVALVIVLLPKEAEKPFTVRFNVVPPENSTINQVALSPQGKYLAYTATGGGKTLLWLRPLGELSSYSLAGTEGAANPFWSPDDQFIGLFSGGKLKKVNASGGTPITICDAPDGRGGTWNRDGTILFAPTPGGVIYSVTAGGGIPKAVTTLDTSKKETHHIWPAFLPDGVRFIYSSRRYDHDRSVIHLASLSSDENETLVTADGNAAISFPGFLVFLHERTLMAQQFNLSTGTLTGDPIPVAENVSHVPRFGWASFTISSNGVVAIGGGRSAKRQFVWFDRRGKNVGSVGPVGNFFDISLSPDGKRVATQFTDLETENSDIWMIDLTVGGTSRFTFHEAVEDDPVWSPDGTTLVYTSIRNGIQQIYQKRVDGKGPEEILPIAGRVSSWSRDGRFLLYNEGETITKDNVMVLPLSGDRRPIAYLTSAAGEVYSQFSPDGKWVAYVSNETGRYEVYVQSFPTSGGKWQISTNGGSQPRWREDGRELFFISADKILMATPVQTGAIFRFGTPQPLFETKVDNYDAPNRYVVANNGQRFLINVPAEKETTSTVTVVVNWTSEIKKR